MGKAGKGESALAPGSVVIVRDEEWLVSQASVIKEPVSRTETRTTQRIEVQGLSELVRDTSAVFFDSLDHIEPLDPRQAELINDESSGYRDSRLWLESTIRKTPVAVDDQGLKLAGGMLIDAKNYQQTPVYKIFNPENLRPRLLIADSVGLGKTVEIGLILAELIRRGRGDRILVVTPKHVLEQMQHEMWTKFAIPFVRLDSEGIKRIRQKLPATRNPFTYFKRAIISIDTLKSDRYVSYLRRHQWDAVVIDESHNVTNDGTLNNRLANILAANTDALVLASATPHNGDPKAFAELIRLLEPTAVKPDGTLDEDAVAKLFVRRHRYSPEVMKEVGTDWAERLTPRFIGVPASPEENEVARELDEVWLHPQGSSPYSGATSALFPWTLAKAFLSSPEALLETIETRLKTIARTAGVKLDLTSEGLDKAFTKATPDVQREATALSNLRTLTKTVSQKADQSRSKKDKQQGKYGALVDHLMKIGIGPKKTERVVIFAERVATLNALATNLRADLKLKDDQVAILHGQLSDQEQQAIVEDFKKANSRVRVLVTGDVASEGVNLHSQCHQLVHFDIPWSLIRIEQRNGRIDRYGQQHSPQITALVLEPESEAFAGDIRVVQKLVEKENEAHKALGDASALMGEYSPDAEEATIKKMLATGRDLDEVVPDPGNTDTFDAITAMMFGLGTGTTAPEASAPAPASAASALPHSEAASALPHSGATAGLPARPAQAPTIHTDNATGLVLYDRPVDYLRDTLGMVFHDQQAEPPAKDSRGGGVAWEDFRNEGVAQLVPPTDLLHRIDDLPQTYIKERGIKDSFKLATTKAKGRDLVDRARNDPNSTSLWPEAHFLGPLHPVLDWAADRSLAGVGRRNAVYAVRADVDDISVLTHATLTNLRGQTVSSIYNTVVFPDPDRPHSAFVGTGVLHDLLDDLGLRTSRSNRGDLDLAQLQALIPIAVDEATKAADASFEAKATATKQRVEHWFARNEHWQQASLDLASTQSVKRRQESVRSEKDLIDAMSPHRTLVRALLVVVPEDTPVPEATPVPDTNDTTHTTGAHA